MSATPFILGVNYWPRRKAMGWWSDFDTGEVREEFAIIKELGLGLVRIFLLWDDWQPAPDTVSPFALQCLEQVCDIAYDSGLKLDITFFVGHMSGPSWVPGWMLLPGQPMPQGVLQVVSGKTVVDCGYRNLFADPLALQAAEVLLRTVVGRFKDHPAIGVWNLGNEPDLFARPPSAAIAKAWVERMTAIIRTLDDRHAVTCGLHAASLVADNGLQVHSMFAPVDLAVMHGYPMYSNWANGPLDPNFVPFLCALTAALCGKPVLAEEFGGCTVPQGSSSAIWEWCSYKWLRRQFMASEEDLAQYFEQVLPRLVETGVLGAMLWCYADYAPDLYTRPPCDESRHERFFGLVRPNGSLKPHAAVFKRFAATSPTVRPALRPVVLDVSPDEYYQAPLAHAKRLYAAFLQRQY